MLYFFQPTLCHTHRILSGRGVKWLGPTKSVVVGGGIQIGKNMILKRGGVQGVKETRKRERKSEFLKNNKNKSINKAKSNLVY